jgi:Tol biopolymer transport system component
MNVDGSGQRRLTTTRGQFAYSGSPAWSPDGQKIAFQRNEDVFVMNADGSGQRRLTTNRRLDGEPDWS